MDLNQLLFHHQVALIRDSDPGTADGDDSLAGHYAGRIDSLRHELGVMPWRLVTTADARPLVAPVMG